MLNAGLVVILIGCKSEKLKTRSVLSDSVFTAALEIGLSEPFYVDTIFWLDTTLIDGRFLEIFSAANDGDFEPLSCRWGNDSIVHYQQSVTNYPQIFIGSIPRNLSWSTKKNLVVTNGCGTNCCYAVFFGIHEDSVKWSVVDYYPNVSYYVFNSDNDSLFVKRDENPKKFNSWVIIDTDSWKTDTVVLSSNYQGIALTDCIDSLRIINGRVEFYEPDPIRKSKVLMRKISLQ